MVETLIPFFTILPLGLSLILAVVCLFPSILILVRPQNPPSTGRALFAGISALVGAWAFLNAASSFLIPA